MSRVNNFFKKCKLPILWTIGYVFVVWAIMHILFHFEIFSKANWIHVSHAYLHGLGGLAFSLIVLATIPLYIATMTIVIRTQKPLLALLAPKFIIKILEKIFPPKPVEVVEEKNESEIPQLTNAEIDRFPAEMRPAFIRARSHPNRITTPICSVCSITPNVYPDSNATPSEPITPDTDLPQPPDFDTDDTFTMPSEPQSAPVFQDIDLYGDDDSSENDTPETIDNPVTEFLKKSNREFNILNNEIILTEKSAIAVHTDSDFWIMDEPTWFASGKTRQSPIKTLLDTAKEHNVQPVLFLGATNIMNLDEKLKTWENDGINVITKPEDL